LTLATHVANYQSEGEDGNIDQRGLVTHRATFHVDTLADVVTAGANYNPFNLPIVGRSYKRLDTPGLGWEVKITYQGSQGDFPETSDVYEYDSSFSREPIEKHPNFEQLKATYGWEYDPDRGKSGFPEFMPSNSSAGGGGLGGGSTSTQQQQKSALFGWTDYPVFRAQFRHSYVRQVLDPTIFSKIGKVTGSLPQGFPTPTGQNWLYQPPKVSKKGNAYDITENLLLSNPGVLWPKDIYSIIQF
jgi:hypothetical protein